MESPSVSEARREVEEPDNVPHNVEMQLDQEAIQNIPDNHGLAVGYLEQIDACIACNVERSRSPHSFGESRRVNEYDADYESDDGRTCPICMDNWTSLGDHRICALKCGHLFGLKCINLWLSMQEAKKTCPTCKERASKRDIRYIYANRLVAVDTWQLEEMKNKMETVIKEKADMHMELMQKRYSENLLKQEIQDLKKEILQSSRSSLSQTETPNQNVACLYRNKALEISNQGKCRVMDSNPKMDWIVASTKSQHNNLFRLSFGLKLINVSDYKLSAFLPLHEEDIRDIRFHPENPSWLLTVSLDKYAKVTDLCSKRCVATTKTNSPIWSCCWAADNSHCFYTGERQGCVSKFDIRNVHAPVATFTVPGNMSPVVSVASVAATTAEGSLTRSGILVCKLDSLWFFEENTAREHPPRHLLPLEGPFVSMSFQNSTRQVLISARPSSKHDNSRHIVASFNAIGTEQHTPLYEIVNIFKGGTAQTLLSRSCFVERGSENYVAAYQESCKCVNLWNIDSGQVATFLNAHEPILDLNNFNNGQDNLLLRLTTKKLEFFKFIT